MPLPESDYIIANLKDPLTTRNTPWDPDHHWSYQVDPAAAVALAVVGVDAVGLANNHSLDRGPRGLAEPLLTESPHGIVAVVVSGDNSGRDRLATRTTVGSLGPSLQRFCWGWL